MAYVEIGPARGRPVIFLHGLADSARSWWPTMQALHRMAPSLHLIAVDQRGHGQSSMPAGASCPADPKSCFRMPYFAQDLSDFMTVRGIRRATIAGHSMGSVIAQDFALDHPGRTERLILVATTDRAVGNPFLRDQVLNEPVKGAWTKALRAKGRGSPAALWSATAADAQPGAVGWMKRNWVFDPVADARFLDAVARDTARMRIGALAGATEALLAADNRARLRRLDTPTLVLWGRADEIFRQTPDQSGIIAALRQSRGAGRVPMFWKAYGEPGQRHRPEIGHSVQWEAPAAVARDIWSFMRTGRPTTDHAYADMASGRPVIRTRPGKAAIIEIR
ncbi:alpha/beta hydrolase [Sphingobium amiense]|uniref:Alpha/beta hydrolase n=1 Tax=Sphingobium amiense TaxID=135719 RepID=A0A494VY56_9SPHN|nr:alpha/beta hydrolase [Sphingobium amiense]BBD96781.1 alpha/beta hydrolase [Sphingobium amiense]